MNYCPIIRFFAGLSLWLAIMSAGCQPPDHHGHRISVWVESIYLRGYNPTTGERLTTQRLQDFCDRLKKNVVTDIYLFAGPYAQDGGLPDYAFSDTALETLRTIREKVPGVRILPWIGGDRKSVV